MKNKGFFRGGLVVAFLIVATAFIIGSPPVSAQDTAAAGQAPEVVWHYFGAAIGLGLIVIGAALGISRFTAAAAESIARQPAAAAQISGAINLPLFLLEGVAIIAEVVILLIVLLK
ncbi:MAG TPA: ATP synthase F0 subunit C [Acidobacteriota bacterium]|nr:ATP synthase F0 subunit C [Acidobacteriota bacterium]